MLFWNKKFFFHPQIVSSGLASPVAGGPSPRFGSPPQRINIPPPSLLLGPPTPTPSDGNPPPASPASPAGDRPMLGEQKSHHYQRWVILLVVFSWLCTFWDTLNRFAATIFWELFPIMHGGSELVKRYLVKKIFKFLSCEILIRLCYPHGAIGLWNLNSG